MSLCNCPFCVEVCELQRRLKASQAEQQEALERCSAAVTQEQQAIQDRHIQVHLLTHTLSPVILKFSLYIQNMTLYLTSLFSRQAKLAGEAQSKYERELMLHAADVEALQQLKKTFQQEAVRKREIEEELKKTTALLQEKTSIWNTMEKQLKVLRPDIYCICKTFFLHL